MATTLGKGTNTAPSGHDGQHPHAAITCELAIGDKAAELAAGGQRAPLPQHERRLRRWRLRIRLLCGGGAAACRQRFADVVRYPVRALQQEQHLQPCVGMNQGAATRQDSKPPLLVAGVCCSVG